MLENGQTPLRTAIEAQLSLSETARRERWEIPCAEPLVKEPNATTEGGIDGELMTLLLLYVADARRAMAAITDAKASLAEV